MKKFTKLLCTLALFFGVVGGFSAHAVTTKNAVFGTPADQGSWNAETNTYSWTQSYSNLMTIFEFPTSDLGNYTSIHLTTSEYTDAYRICFMNNSTLVATIAFYTAGQKDINFAERNETKDLDMSTITHISFGGASASGSIVLTNVYLEGPDIVLPTIDDSAPWTASEVGAGNFMLYNVGTGQYLTKGNGWGTQASITTAATAGNGFAVELIAVGDNYKIRTGVNDNSYGLENLNGGTVYTDQSRNKNSAWTFVPVATSNGPVYNIISADNHGGGSGAYLTAGVDGTIVTPGNDGTIDGAKWKLMALPAQPVGMADASEENPVDATSLIVNQNFSFPGILQSGTGSWTVNASNKNLCGGDVTNPCGESWRSAFTISQTLNVPNGIYEVTAQAALTDYAEAYDGKNYPVVFANDETAVFNEMEVADRGTSMNQLSGSFTNGKYGVGPIRVVVTNGSLTIGVRGTRTDTWCIWDNFRLTYKGVDLSELRAALQTQINAVASLEGTTTTAAYNAAKNYADGINVDDLADQEAISTASSELAALVATAEALQTNYARYQSVKTAVLAISADVDTEEADAAVNAATTNDAIDAAVVALRAALLAYLPSVELGEGEFVDVTAAMVDNAGVHTNTDYWTTEGTPNGGFSFGVCNFGECEFYNCNFKFFQTLALARGTWEFGVTGFHRGGQGDYSTYFYAGEDKILIPGVANTVVNSMAEAQTYFNNGNGKVSLKFVIESAQDVEIGIDNQDTQTDKWTIFRDFTLKYYGKPDYSVYEEQWSDAVTAANTALDAQAYKYISGNERTAVTDAIADVPDGSSKANYLEKIQALEAATATFTAAAPSYNAWVLAKTETKNLWGSPLGVTDPTTAAEAAEGVHALNVAQYNKVASDYTFSATGLIGDFGSWTGTATVAGQPAEPNYLDWEHWSGEFHAYYEQAASGWGNANGWTIQYEKTCTLPAGEYVIKVAARSSAGTTSRVSCSATEKIISLPNLGSPGRGINTSGVASWSDSDTFANGDITNPVNAPTVGGKGTGWQWRFLPFTLDEQTEVTMTFYAEASTQYQWMSIADGELLSTTKLAQDVAYDEDEDNTITNTIIADVTMARTIKEGYNTVCLPFTLTANQVTAAFGTGTEVYAFSENSADPDDATINFNKGDGSITANVPVLVKATAASEEQVFEGVQIVAADADVKKQGTNFDFIGVYAPASVPEDDYFIGNGAIYRSKGATSIKAFRAYIHDTTGGSEVKFFLDGEAFDLATAISEINDDAAVNGTVYNLAGQRVNKAVKGLYIVNGKKVVIK